jgi:GT2 family glycosyltransferase
MISVAILMTVFNRKEQTLRCLDSILSQELLQNCKLTTYLTNDGCTDGTPETVGDRFPDVKIIEGDGTLFWNRGMYAAWAAAAKDKDYDFYLWLNDDCLLYPQMLKMLLKASSTKDDKAIIVGATQTFDHTKQTYGGRMNDNSFPVMGDGLQPVDYFNGNIVLIPRQVFIRLGNLDSYFSHRFGDFDYGLRARKVNIRIYQIDEFLGECDLHESLDKWCNPAVSFAERWKALWKPNGMPPHEVFHFERKHHGLPKACYSYFSTIIHCCMPSFW